MTARVYEPSRRVVQRLAGVDFAAVIGPTAVGKTTLIRAAMAREPRLHLVLNNTSRARRADEQDGVDYRFLSRAEMERRIALREYVQVAPTRFGDLYATAAEDYVTAGVAVLPVLADAMPAFRALPFRRMCAVYVVPPDAATWLDRLAQRGIEPERFAKRLAEAADSLHFGMRDEGVCFVVNDDIEAAADDFVALVTQRPWSGRIRRAQRSARGIVSDLLAEVRLRPPSA